MVKVHRALLARTPAPRAVLLDATYGFQENVPQMTAKLVDFFSTSLHTELRVASLPRYDAASPLARQMVKDAVARADYVFAGPGSPSYALAQWAPLGLTDDLATALDHGAALCFASAASLTLGSHTAPIYEVYKAGADPTWLPGLDLLSRYGLSCAVIPHWDNAEGRDHDTSRCFLGERRLALLEEQLPDDVAILGVDEHTALLLDLATDTAAATGRGRAHWRRGHDGRTIGPDPVPLDELRTTAARARATSAPAITAISEPGTLDAHTLGEAAARGDLVALASLVRRAEGVASGGLSDPLVDAVLAARAMARAGGDYDLADRLRAALVDAQIEVRDGPVGARWSRGTVTAPTDDRT